MIKGQITIAVTSIIISQQGQRPQKGSTDK
jgi:hypothetical protein